jgi:hypothetical protein
MMLMMGGGGGLMLLHLRTAVTVMLRLDPVGQVGITIVGAVFLFIFRVVMLLMPALFVGLGPVRRHDLSSANASWRRVGRAGILELVPGYDHCFY